MHFTDLGLCQSWLADRLHISRRHLNRCFEGHPGTSYLIATWRLGAAIHVMTAHPTLPLQDVAHLCGYSTYETLRSQARKFYGRTPRELRTLTRRHVMQLPVARVPGAPPLPPSGAVTSAVSQRRPATPH